MDPLSHKFPQEQLFQDKICYFIMGYTRRRRRAGRRTRRRGGALTRGQRRARLKSYRRKLRTILVAVVDKLDVIML